MRRTLVTRAAALSVAPAATAAGAVTVTRDATGRPIRIDVRAPGVSAGLYAGILRTAIHGGEISDVTVVVVPRRRIAALCGDDSAASCYQSGDRGVITVPAGDRGLVAPLLLHEYGHHIDATRANGDVPEPNGTPRWWKARHMATRLRSGQVAFDYSRGWSHSVGEVFAEDYVQLNMPGSVYAITWLPRPSASVLAAMRKDLGTAAAPPAGQPAPTPAPPSTPVVVDRSGELGDGESGSLPFTLLGPGRRVRVDVSVTALDPGAAIEAVVSCDGSVIGRASGSDGAPIAVDVPDAGPGDCDVTLTGAGGTADFDLRLTLSRTA